MADKTGIEWTDATWNPVRGCSRVSEGCRHCYAEQVAKRFSGPGLPYEGLVKIGADGKGKAQWSGKIKFIEEHLLDPLKWKRPRRIFVNSMSDLFHEGVTDEQLDRIFAVMALSPQHTFQVLTKRPERMLAYLSQEGDYPRALAISDAWADWHDLPEWMESIIDRAEVARRDRDAKPPDYNINLYWPLPNVWLGVSVEDQKTADARIPLLLQTPAAVRFVSYEPALGPVDLDRDHNGPLYDGHPTKDDIDGPYGMQRIRYGSPRIDWVICGGESGSAKDIRPMHPVWVRGVRDQCVAAGVPFFFKQWGEWVVTSFRRASADAVPGNLCRVETPGEPDHFVAVSRIAASKMERVGKKAAGDLLDGKQWHEFPEVRP